MMHAQFPRALWSFFLKKQQLCSQALWIPLFFSFLILHNAAMLDVASFSDLFRYTTTLILLARLFSAIKLSVGL